jgi:hypothetical protein
MTDTFTDISHLIKSQFPQFYLEEGPDLVTFVEEYYKWAESAGGLEKSRNLLTNRDIDETADIFLQFFQHKYMAQLPDVLIADKRELQKHILDLYRSKGSEAGLRLLFRLLYGEDIEIYIPSYDILKASDGIWIEEKYLEVSPSILFTDFNNKRITGFDSDAFAFVDRIERRVVRNKNIFLLFLTDINGEFVAGERVTFEGATLRDCPFILGTPQSLSVTSVSTGYQVGDEVTAINGSGAELRVVVSETVIGRGIIDFQIVDGGNGYAVGTELTVTTGSNTSGSGAAGFVSSIDPQFTYEYNDDLIEPYLAVQLDSAEFAFSNTDTSIFGQANLATIITNALQFQTIQLGIITGILTTNPGINYDADVNVSVFDATIGPLNLPDGSGGFLGQNAVITGSAVIGALVSELRITNSGFGYINEPIEFSGNGSPIFADVTVGGTGFIAGFWQNNQGFLNSDKYLQDSFFYQEYSYEIGSSRSIDKYIDVLKSTVHPAGNEVFGRGFSINTNDYTPTITSADITQSI